MTTAAPPPPGVLWHPVATAPHVLYVVLQSHEGVVIYFQCRACGDWSQKPCVAFRERGAHWIATYAAMHTGPH